MGIAEEIIDRTNNLASDRHYWLQVWMDISRLVLPTESAANSFNTIVHGAGSGTGRPQTAGMSGPNATGPVKNIYDNTGMMAVERLASGMESLVTPQSEKWHGLTVADVLKPEPTDEENIYLESLRNFQFSLRYDPKAGFIPGHQKAMRSCVAFGTGVVYIEQPDLTPPPGETYVPIRYQYCPLPECLLGTNENGSVDTNYRVRTFTVKQLIAKFGHKNCSARVCSLYEQGNLDQPIEVIHAVCPRRETGSMLGLFDQSGYGHGYDVKPIGSDYYDKQPARRGVGYGLEKTIKGSPIASYYVEVETKHLLSDSGFYEFPFAVYHWLQQDNGPYGESPVMLCLSEIKSLQMMGKSELRAFAQWTDPPLGMVHDGMMNRPNLNPRAINPGAIGPDGSLRVRPLLTAQSPDFAEKVMEARRMGVKETMYINLFQTLIKDKEMTATQAMLRANEKGELLGPAGGKIQAALSTMADRELAILGRLGVYRPNSPLAPPVSLSGRQIAVRMTSPLDRMRRANEGVGTTQLLNVALPMVKVKPEVLDNFDLDQTIRNLREIFGAPANTLVPAAIMEAKREQTLKQQQAMMALQAGTAAGGIAKDASIAGRNAAETAQQLPAAAGGISGLLDMARQGMAANENAPAGAVDATNALLSQFGKPPVPGASGLPSGG